MFVATNVVVIATKVVFVAPEVCLLRQKCAHFCRDKTWTDLCRAKCGINICVTTTRFGSSSDDILVKGRSYINQSKSVLLMALVHPLKMEGERNIFLLRVEAEIEIHDDILRT